MTSLKQIEANRQNALKSTGPRTEQGKRRSRHNALRHGLTAETVIAAFESAVDYGAFEASIRREYQPRTATDRELISRLASVLWRLRRSTSIETGLFQIQAELMQNQNAGLQRRRNARLPEWYDNLDVADSSINGSPIVSSHDNSSSESLAHCFLQVSRLGCGTFDLLTRYETALWRQVVQLLFMLRAATPR